MQKSKDKTWYNISTKETCKILLKSNHCIKSTPFIPNVIYVDVIVKFTVVLYEVNCKIWGHCIVNKISFILTNMSVKWFTPLVEKDPHNNVLM